MPQKDQEARRTNNSERVKNNRTQNKKQEQSRKSRKRAVKRNRKYVEAYKMRHPCPCGEIEPCCLSFHHNHDDKAGNISDMVNRGYGLSRIQNEINKCSVLCLNCHAKLHNMGKEENKEEAHEVLELMENR